MPGTLELDPDNAGARNAVSTWHPATGAFFMANIILNGSTFDLEDDTTIGALLGRLKIPCDGTAVAINGSAVARGLIATQKIEDGDRIDIIRAIGGG